jgi:hypothetical protein
MLHFFHDPLCDGHQGELLLKRIPKRVRDGPIPNDEQEAWGIAAEHGLAFGRGILWIFLILLAGFLGGVAFVVFWLSKHSADLQNAFVPLQVILSILGLFSIPFTFMQGIQYHRRRAVEKVG